MTYDPSDYDPTKAHEYYLRTRELKGRRPGQVQPQTSKVTTAIKKASTTRVRPAVVKPVDQKKDAQARVVRLTEKIHKLSNALKEAEIALRHKQAENRKNSDGKTTVKERQQSKQYRDKHKTELAAKAKKEAAASKPSGSSSSSSSKPKSVSEMSETDLKSRITKIKGLITTAKQQLRSANALAHSMSETSFIRHSGQLTVNTISKGDSQNGS